MTFTHALTQADGVTVDNANGYVRFERGPVSMFRKVMIQDANGNLLETLENYNRSGPVVYHGEGFIIPGNTIKCLMRI